MYYFQAPALYCTLIIHKSATVQGPALSEGRGGLAGSHANKLRKTNNNKNTNNDRNKFFLAI